MDKIRLLSWLLGVILQMSISAMCRRTTLEGDLPSSMGVQLLQLDKHVIIANGIVSVTLTVPGSAITNITYKESDNLLQPKEPETERGDWDIVWKKTGTGDMTDNLEGTNYKVIVQNDNHTEISFTRTWTFGSNKAPLNVDKRFIMRRGSPGFYTYAVLEHLKRWPAFELPEGRVVFKLHDSKFHYMAVSDVRQRIMPTPKDRASGQVLDYEEAVLLTNPSNPKFKGEVDDKYLYSCDNQDNKVHGWVSSNPPVGFWMITPSDEFKTGGPIKQDLTSHIGATSPIVLSMHEEVVNWPYNFPLSEDFVKPRHRGAVRGQLLVHDRFVNRNAKPGASAYLGLVLPGPTGSWQFENKGYQFWTKTDSNGKFAIKNVIPGTYSLFAWVPGVLGDYKYASEITITQGSNIEVKNMVFEAPRTGATLWEIGIPDRSAAEFFIPNPAPKFKIHNYPNGNVEKFDLTGYHEYFLICLPSVSLS